MVRQNKFLKQRDSYVNGRNYCVFATLTGIIMAFTRIDQEDRLILLSLSAVPLLMVIILTMKIRKIDHKK